MAKAQYHTRPKWPKWRNSFLQFIDQDDSDSLILAATNHPGILDYALYPRFDDVISFELPDLERIADTLKAKLAAFRMGRIDWPVLAREAEGLSYAEITRACEGAVKDMIIHDLPQLEQSLLSRAIQERKTIASTSSATA